MIFNKKKIQNKEPFFGTVKIGLSNWEEEIFFLDTHPEKLIDTHPEKIRYFLKGSDTRPSLSPWAKDVLKTMGETFHKNRPSLIKFLGFGYQTDSYPWHKDTMDVFLVQVLGTPLIKVENTNCQNKAKEFKPGDCVFIPRGTHHEIVPTGSRVTYSFGVEDQPDPSSYVKP